MVIDLEVVRFVCGNPDCGVATFVEQVPGLTERHQHRTPGLRGLLEATGLALAGRAGARLSCALGTKVSRSTLLRLVRALPDPEVGQVTVLGVDDFALKRGRVYGTILVNMATGKAIDLLDGRAAEPFAQWLRDHPGTEVIYRDRAGAYSLGAKDGAPDAIQCADRWHLWHNLAQYAEKTVARHRGCLKDPAPPVPEPESAAISEPAEQAEPRLVERTRMRYAAVQELKDGGATRTAVSRTLGLDPRTVNRFWGAAGIEELLTKATGRSDLLTPYTAQLHQRWNDGVTDAAQLTKEITELGYTGSTRTIRRYLQPFRAMLTIPPPPTPVPKTRHITGWILRHPDTLTTDEQAQLADARARCPHLDALADHVTAFAKMMTGRSGAKDLEGWLTSVEAADDQSELRSFATGIRWDQQAVTNGLSLPHNSGTCEGNVNRLKILKRQMFGRAGLDLLRKRVVLLA
jgi:transposase